MIHETHIIGREKELSILHDIYNKAKSGQGQIVLLAGEAGMGKTLLAEKSLFSSGFKVYTGRIMEKSTPAYGPVSSILSDILKDHPGILKDLKSVRSQLKLLLPEFEGFSGFSLGEKEAALQPENKDQLQEAVLSVLFRSGADSPTAIFLDDLHWADDATIELLAHLGNRLHDRNLLVLGTFRSDEISRDHRVRWLRNTLRRQHRLHEIALRPISQNDCHDLVSVLLPGKPDRSLTDLIFQQTQGVPFFIEELTRTIIEQDLLTKEGSCLSLIPGKRVPIPESILDAVLLRLDSLSPAARKQLETASLIGMEFDLALLLALTGLETGIDELLDRHLIAESTPGRASFRHTLTREAVRSEISWSHRRDLSHAIAERLEKAGSSPEVVADHWMEAGDNNRARTALLSSADIACRMHAYRDAAKSARKALDVWPKGDAEEERLQALEKLAHCAQVSGQFPDALRALRELTQSTSVNRDPGRLGETHRKMANVLILQGHWEQSLEAREKSAAAFEEAGLPADSALEWLSVAVRNTGTYNLSRALRLSEHTETLAEKAGRPDILARALALKGNILSMMGQFDAGMEAGQKGLDLALQHNSSEAASEAYRRLASTLEYASEYESSKDTYFTAYNYCQTQGANAQAQLCLSCMSWVLFRTGDWKQCLEICSNVIRDNSSSPQTRGLAKCVQAIVQVHRGERRNARKNLQDALNQGYRYESLALQILACWGLALLEEQEKSVQRANSYYQKVLELREESRDNHDALLPLCSAVTFYAGQSREQETARCINGLAEMASNTSNTEALGALAFSLGENALMTGEPREAAQQFRQALQHFEKLKTPLELAKIEARLGVALIDTGEKKESIPHLKNSYQLYRKLGCRSLASRVAEILETAGASAEERRSPESKERAARGGLTSRQLEILRLIADGLTNKEIAGKLFLSPRTVEMHVANLLDRLDCRSRSEAVHRAGEMGLLD